MALAAVAAALQSFRPAITGIGWWWAAVLVAALAVCVAALGRRVGLPAPAAGIAALAILPFTATAIAGGGASIAFVVPTARSSTALVQAIQSALEQIQRDAVPTQATAGLLVLITAGAALAAVVAETVAVGLRAPLAAAPVVLALALVPGRVLPIETNAWQVGVTVLMLLLLIGADRRRRGEPARLPGLLAVSAVAVVGSLAVQQLLPVPAQQSATAGSVLPIFGRGANPLLQLGQALRRGGDTAVLTYTTTSDEPVSLRVGVLERFTGSTWYPNEASSASGGETRARSGTEAAPGVLGVGSVSGRAVVTRVEALSGAVSTRLPITYPAVSVSGEGVASFDWDARGLTLVRRSSSPEITSYRITSLDDTVSTAALRSADASVPAAVRSDLSVPADAPAVLQRTADAWTAGATTPFDKALAIQDRLRSGAFSYDTEAPATHGYDGDGVRAIADFLKAKAGYCIHFASTMAVLARLEGIPSRVVVGYQPGTASAVNGRTQFTVSTDDLHAWPELYFSGVGWVRFEPTPGRGTTPSYAPVADGSTSDSQRAATLQPGAARSNAPAATATATPSATPTAAGSAARTGSGAVDLVPVGSWLLILLCAAAPALARIAVRRARRRRSVRDGTASPAWAELLDTALDLGRRAPRDRGARQAAEAFEATLTTDARAALTRILGAYERETYGTADAVRVHPADLDLVLHGLRAAAGPLARIVAVLAPRSLIGTIARSRLAFRWSPPGSDE